MFVSGLSVCSAPFLNSVPGEPLLLLIQESPHSFFIVLGMEVTVCTVSEHSISAYYLLKGGLLLEVFALISVGWHSTTDCLLVAEGLIPSPEKII